MRSKAKETAKATSLACVLLKACGCQKKKVVYETVCRHIAVQRGKQDQNYL